MNKILLFLSSYHVACLVNNKLPSILLENCIYLMQQKVVQKDRTFLCTWTLHKTKKGFMMLAEAAESRSSNRSSEFSLFFFSQRLKCWPLCGIFKKEKLPQGGVEVWGRGLENPPEQDDCTQQTHNSRTQPQKIEWWINVLQFYHDAAQKDIVRISVQPQWQHLQLELKL